MSRRVWLFVEFEGYLQSPLLCNFRKRTEFLELGRDSTRSEVEI